MIDRVGANVVGWATRSAETFYLRMIQKSGFIQSLGGIVLEVQTLASVVSALIIGVPSLLISSFNNHIRFCGNAPQKPEDQKTIKIASWNINGIPFNQVVDHTAPFYERVQGIIKLLEGHDLIMLQEAFGDSAYMILKAVQLYQSAFGRSGVQVTGLDSGHLCLTTLKVIDFQFNRFKQGSNIISRGFSSLETEKTVFIQTHLISGHDNKEIRIAQMEQIKKFVDRQTKPCIVMGDLNIGDDRETELAAMKLNGFELRGSKQTCWENGEPVGHDLIMLEKGKFQVQKFSELGEMPANSDHKLLSVEVSEQHQSKL